MGHTCKKSGKIPGKCNQNSGYHENEARVGCLKIRNLQPSEELIALHHDVEITETMYFEPPARRMRPAEG